jgi:hypothetical protein
MDIDRFYLLILNLTYEYITATQNIQTPEKPFIYFILVTKFYGNTSDINIQYGVTSKPTNILRYGGGPGFSGGNRFYLY